MALCSIQVSPAFSAATPATVTVASKNFTESVILGEMLRLLAKHSGAEAVHRRQLGGTRVLWNALLSGDIDAYPEYTGTLLQEILVKENLHSDAQLRAALAKHGLRMTRPLGFNNTYAIGVKATLAERLGLRTISDLRRHPELVFGFSNEFMDRADGWPGLQRRYALPQRNVRGLDHDLAYRGIEAGTLQVTDLYATDAEITVLPAARADGRPPLLSGRITPSSSTAPICNNAHPQSWRCSNAWRITSMPPP